MSTCSTVQPVSSPGGPDGGPGRCSCWLRLTTDAPCGAASDPGGEHVQLGRDGPELRQLGRGELELDAAPRPGRPRRRRARRQVGERAHAVDAARPRGRPRRAPRADPASVNRRGSGSPGPHRPSGSSRACRASAKWPATVRASDGRVAVGDQDAERAAGTQHRDQRLDRRRGPRRRARGRRGRGPGRRCPARPRRAARRRRPGPRGPTAPVSPARRCSEARASGLGSTTVTRWPSLGQRDGEPAGAAADVDHVQRVVAESSERP